MSSKMKKWASLLLVFVLALGFIPPFAPEKAKAASSFFYPDDPGLANVANLDVTAGLTPSVSYLSKQRNINITGTFNGVNSDSLNVTVEQMYKDTSGWHPDTTRKFTKGLTTQSNKFEVTNLQLFTGYNKVTFKGTQSGADKYDVYYILYEDVPYIKSLKIGANSEEPIDLNEGASVVFKKPVGADVNFKMMSYIQGVAANSTKVTVGSSVVSPTDEGAFFAPPMELKPGRNDITILIGNESNTIELKRTVYYYDDKNPFIGVSMNHATTETGELINNTPTFTAGTDGVASTSAFTVNMLVPYSSNSFTATVTADVYNNASSQTLVFGAVTKEETIYGRNGQPDLENVTFTVSGYNIPGAASGAQKLDLNVDYNGQKYSTPVLNYNIYRGSVQIKNIKMLPDYPPSSGTYDMNKAISLNNAEYSKPEFYIEVETDKDLSLITPVPVLAAVLLPYKSTDITVDPITVSEAKKRIYKVSNLPTGTSQLRFQYNGSLSGYNVNVNYVSQKYISVDNLYDGQTIEVDSSILTGGNIAPIPISGELKNFENPKPVQLTVNGKSITVTLDVYNKFTNSLRFTSDTSADDNGDSVNDAGPLYFGENLIRIIVEDQAAVNHLITKEIRIYIMDKNMPKILKLQPAEIPIGLTRTVLDSNTFNVPFKQFRFVDNKYVTSLKKFDFVFSGSGADNIKVKRNGELLLEISGTGAVISNKLQDPEKYFAADTTHFNGDEKLFYVRLKDLQMLSPGTQTYEITLRNKTGATVTQSVTIQREVSDFVIWSPVPTVGNRVVVNKNFVLFDIEAEGAESVLIDGKAASPRADLKDRFTYTYIGLKAEKEQSIKVSIVRNGKTVTNTVKVLYTTTVQTGSMSMAKMGAKLSVFNGQLNLTFPKGTILKTANPNLLVSKQPQYYDQTNLLFGIAEPELGIVERVNDYGQNVGTSNDWRTPNGTGSVVIDPYLSGQFSYTGSRSHFTMVSPIFWISGGLGENQLTKKQATDGITPYSVDGTFTKYEQDRKLVPTERGELTLQFNKNVVDAAGPTVTVFHFNDKGEWTRVGGVVNTKNNTITVPFYDFGYYVVAKLREGYTDLTRHGWARNILETLYAKGYMENARTDEFGAEDYITRGEFTTLLIRALEMPLNYEGENTFYDVYPNTNMLWQYEQIETAARNGIVAGKDDRYFGVNERINRGQAATIIARALKLKTPLNDEKLAQQLSKAFTDGALMAESNYYAMPSISAVVKAGYMDGIPNQLLEGQNKATVRFEADANMTRAQAGAIMVRILKDYSKVLPKNFDEGFDS